MSIFFFLSSWKRKETSQLKGKEIFGGIKNGNPYNCLSVNGGRSIYARKWRISFSAKIWSNCEYSASLLEILFRFKKIVYSLSFFLLMGMLLPKMCYSNTNSSLKPLMLYLQLWKKEITNKSIHEINWETQRQTYTLMHACASAS